MKTHQEIHEAIENGKRFGISKEKQLDILHALNDRIEAINNDHNALLKQAFDNIQELEAQE